MLLLHLTQLVCPPCHSFLHVLSQATHFPGRGCTSGSAWTGQSSQQGSGAGKLDMQRSILPHSLLGPSAPHLCKWYRVCGRDGGGLQLRDGLSPVGCGASWWSFLVLASCCSASQSNYSIPLAPLSGVSSFPFDKTLSFQVEIAERQTLSPTGNL